MAAVAGLRGSGDWATDERPKSFREMIMWREQRGMAPVLGLSSRARKESVADPEFNWWDEPIGIVRLQLNGAVSSTTQQTLTVDSADPSTSAPGINWGLAKHLVPGDLLLYETELASGETAAFANEIVEVVQVLSDTSIIVKRGAAGTTAATMADNGYLLKIGSSFAEGTGAPKSVSRNPMKYTNYCQIFKTTYEITGTAEVTSTRTGDPVSNDKKRRMWDHARDIELAILFGQSSETTGENGKPLRTTKGLRRFIPTTNVTIFSAAVTSSTFLDAVYKVFDYDTPAGDERIVFCGNQALNEFNKVAQSSGDISFGPVIRQWGLALREMILPQGRLYFRTHPIFNQHSTLNKAMLIVDFSALRWRFTKGRDTKFQDNVQAKDEDVRRGQWMTEGGLEVFYGGLTCGYLGNISST